MSHKIILTEEIKESIYRYYLDENLSREEVAEKLGIGLNTLCNFLKELGIKKDIKKIKECRAATFMKEYGVTNASNLSEVRAKIGQKNHANAETRVAKIKKTKKEKYGDPN